MALIDEYQGDDDECMEANNASTFNCRTTDRGAMSRHALEWRWIHNPYGEGNVTSPAAGRACTTSHTNAGIAVRAFAR